MSAIFGETVPEFTAQFPSYEEMRQTILGCFPPTEQRPDFDLPRFWSNPALSDPDRILALILANPTMADLGRAIHAYGPDRVVTCLTRMVKEGALEGVRLFYTIRLVKLALEGVADAALRVAAR